MNMILEKISSLKESKSFSKYILYIGILGMILILISSLGQNKSSKSSAQNDGKGESEYIKTMETRLKSLICATEGAGKTEVLITLESGVEYVYAKEERLSSDLSEDISQSESKRVQKSDNTENKYILVDGENGKKALIQKEIEPVIQGVVVVCEGGDKQVIKHQITEIVTTALNIPSTKVCVIKKAVGH
ncbi:MAG: stage III sporulation protein AG [Oscillospiraceae bacterium]